MTACDNSAARYRSLRWTPAPRPAYFTQQSFAQSLLLLCARNQLHFRERLTDNNFRENILLMLRKQLLARGLIMRNHSHGPANLSPCFFAL
jgi:hypothetical protein